MPTIFIFILFLIYFQNVMMATEGELRINADDSERVREMQEQIAELRAEVTIIEYLTRMKQFKSI